MGEPVLVELLGRLAVEGPVGPHVLVDVIPGDEGAEERKLVKGDFALVLPHEKHQFRNTSTGEPLVIICGVPVDYE